MTPIVGGGTYDAARAACDLAITTGGYHKIGHRAADLGLLTVILQEGGYYLPGLGVNVREWLRGRLRLPPDPAPPPRALLGENLSCPPRVPPKARFLVQEEKQGPI